MADHSVVYFQKNANLVDEVETVSFNVSGVIFQTLRSTILRMPGTKLYHIIEHPKAKNCREIFIDRHPGLFDAILNYYRTKELHLPKDLCGSSLKHELEYYGIPDQAIEPCCWVGYSAEMDTQGIVAKFDESSAADRDALILADTYATTTQRNFRKIWNFMEDPNSSGTAKVYKCVNIMHVYFIPKSTISTFLNASTSSHGRYTEIT
ncbi:potassium voltage-gated channel protein Shaw-like [Tubulanus polymorphus]|uniref:potassium voltage-gated channel protein Shaw-like n=1 Tax=Tubulanus polymorphus TaxID=672921 RepID=UPI003DA4E23A